MIIDYNRFVAINYVINLTLLAGIQPYIFSIKTYVVGTH